MINKTRIFISSAYEDDLKKPRQRLKEKLEESGHEVPIFENRDFGTWEKDTMKQCIDNVKKSDILILLINKKAGNILTGDVTPTYYEYKAAKETKKHILVFVSEEIKVAFDVIYPELKDLYNEYLEKNYRIPGSPYEPFKEWLEKGESKVAKPFTQKADLFVWAFLFEIYKNKEWLYTFNFSETTDETKKILEMLSTSFRSVVNLIPEKEAINDLKVQAEYLLNYAEYTLELLALKNELDPSAEIESTSYNKVLEKVVSSLANNVDIILAEDYNPQIVNTIKECYAASLYVKVNNSEMKLVGTYGEITASEIYLLHDTTSYVSEAYNNKEKIISFREDKQTIYVTEIAGSYVFCFHFNLEKQWNDKNAAAYNNEVESAIMKLSSYHYDYFKLILGGVL